MRFPDDRKHEHKPPHAEVCVSFWLDAEMHRQLHDFAHMVQLTKSDVIRDALILHIERKRKFTNLIPRPAPAPHAGHNED